LALEVDILGMADRIIDLRKRDSEVKETVPKLEPLKELAIEWSAKEYENRPRDPARMFFLGVVAIILITAGILMKSYFFVGLIMLSFLVLIMYERKRPATIGFSLTAEGIKSGKILYKFSDLKSFWIFIEARELSLESSKIFSRFLRLPLGNTDPERVRAYLRNFLPEQKHKEFFSDHLARNL